MRDGRMELTPASQFFAFLLQSFLGCRDRRLVAAIWRAFPKDQVLLYQLSLCASPAWTDLDTITRLKHLSTLIDPKQLIYTIEKLPVPGRRRPPAVIALEERVLLATTKDGEWRW
jgi:hypothetical protein